MLPQPQDSTLQDVPQQIDIDTGSIFEKLDTWVDGFFRLIPNIAVGIVVFIVFIFIARLVSRAIRRSLESNDRDNLGEVAGGFVKYLLYGIGTLLALTVIVPTLNPGDLIAGLGVSSVAIGFAFKDILQNWLAGLLILLRQPFEIGDQIVVNGFEGTVERIETRATIIKQYNAQRVVIPNSEIYTNSVKVNTANDLTRSQYDIGIGYGDDINAAKKALEKAVIGIDGVNNEKGVEVLPWDLAASWVTLRVRWWTDSPRANVVQVYAKVIQQIKISLDEANIDMPNETIINLIHDQTDEFDGDRTKQREGWTANKEDNPRPRWQVEAERTKGRDSDQSNRKNPQE